MVVVPSPERSRILLVVMPMEVVPPGSELHSAAMGHCATPDATPQWPPRRLLRDLCCRCRRRAIFCSGGTGEVVGSAWCPWPWSSMVPRSAGAWICEDEFNTWWRRVELNPEADLDAIRDADEGRHSTATTTSASVSRRVEVGTAGWGRWAAGAGSGGPQWVPVGGYTSGG
jgi:hypothetical protein